MEWNKENKDADCLIVLKESQYKPHQSANKRFSVIYRSKAEQ